MATAVADATRPSTTDTIPVPVPRRLVRRMGVDGLRQYLERLDADAAFLEAAGGGQLQSSIDVRSKATGGGIGDVHTAPRRKV